EVPDVTANGDPNTGYVIYYNGEWSTMGGTSISTPTWAALAALADSSPACAGHPVGFANPALYKLAGSAYGANFGDVTSGANGYDHVTGFSAGPGYDMASGLGTPNARSIVPALCGGQPIPAATASTRPTAPAKATVAHAGGVTLARLGARSSRLGTRVRVRLRARDAHGLAMRYSATGLPRGLRINSRTGVITGRAKYAGTRRVTVRVSNGRGGFATASFRWRVRPAPHPA
ncbi:MAG TPA: putative Ig domain-containing protein, partial [Solirubrobacteraceae bacterium]|nr:putative Ig domain-containing protein [Solirubrobacteraceae bacterium]